MKAFLEDLAQSEDWSRERARALMADNRPVMTVDSESVEILRRSLSSDQEADAFARVVTDFVHIALHSALVAIDGGCASAEVGSLELVEVGGDTLPGGLHELYVDHLFDTGRMT